MQNIKSGDEAPKNKPGLNRSLEDEMVKGLDEQNKVIDMPVSNKAVLKALYENEDGDAYLLIKLIKDRYLYDTAVKEWYYWNDHFWRLDKLNHVTNLIKEVIDLYGTQSNYEAYQMQKAKTENDEKAEKKHKKNMKMLKERIQALRTLKRKQMVLKLAAMGVNSLAFTGETWDSHPMLLGCRNGCLNLEEGTFNPGNPSDYIKTVSPVRWEGINAPCPTWKKFLYQMFSNNQDIVDCIQRLLGYGITGLNTEHIFPIFWGPEGRNGKGTLFETLKYVLGDMAYKAPSNFLMEQNFKGGSTGPDAVTMGLMGKRIVWCSETNEKDRLDVAKLKELVGGDTLSARLPYARRQVEFSTTHLLLTITNMRPRVPANDVPLWKRIILIPLENSFIDNPDPKKKNQFKADKNLGKKLKEEASGILAWLVEGCLLWQKHGINPPGIISAATEEYRENEDIVGDFIRESCIEEDDELIRIKTTDSYSCYKEWCKDVGHHPMAKKRFLDDMETRFVKTKSHGHHYFEKIRFRDF